MAMQAYHDCQNARAWEAFCAVQGVDSDDLLAAMPGLRLTQIVNDHMRNISPTGKAIEQMFPVDLQLPSPRPLSVRVFYSSHLATARKHQRCW